MKIIDYKELTPKLASAGCFVLNMPNEAYHAYDGISRSGLDLVSKSPLHFLAGGKPKSKRHLELGTALHTAILEPARFSEDYLILKGVKARTASEYKQAVKSRGSETTLIESEAVNILGVQDAITDNEAIFLELSDCDLFEVSAFVSINGLLCKCRYDALNTKTAVSIDVKSTQSSAPEDFSKSVANYRYHVQDAFYSAIYAAITGERLNAFKFLAVENEPPHCPMLYQLDGEARAIGQHEAEKDLEAYDQAMTSNVWRGYEHESKLLSLPNWAVSRYENELDEGIV